jgi:hypothetical protein
LTPLTLEIFAVGRDGQVQDKMSQQRLADLAAVDEVGSLLVAAVKAIIFADHP